MHPSMSRRDIYYWKCDRPAAFHGTEVRGGRDLELERQLHEAMRRKLGCRDLVLTVAASQGNHLTWNADVDGVAMFVRLENGPERDDYIGIESVVMQQVRGLGVPVPEVFAVDASRTHVAGAWQAIERVPFPDLNQWFKQGVLDGRRIAFDIGAAVARWQAIEPSGFGPFESGAEQGGSLLSAFHVRYENYFRLRLDQHLRFLVERGFFTLEQCGEIERVISDHHTLLQFDHGCLVHKDLALWNVLGSRDSVAAFIDFDDAISGDPMDDLSLLACFHDAAFVWRAFEGYQSVRPLPEEHLRRFWLHLLRNMIVKSVIRVGAGYFERDGGFFLIGSGGSGADLKRLTLERLNLAVRGLSSSANIAGF